MNILPLMFGLGFSEILILAGMALILIGPKELPAIATAIGRFLNELKRSTDDFSREIKSQAQVDLGKVRSDLNQTLKDPAKMLEKEIKSSGQGLNSAPLNQDGLKNETSSSDQAQIISDTNARNPEKANHVSPT